MVLARSMKTFLKKHEEFLNSVDFSLAVKDAQKLTDYIASLTDDQQNLLLLAAFRLEKKLFPPS